jgi:pyruvate formate lyase activating enzyme
MQEATLYQKLEGGKVKCNLCNHRCLIEPEKFGICKVRKNVEGVLYTLVYGKVIARHLDPIEKKPLFHFFPGSSAYSIATVGCNFKCLHCQNADISQFPRERELIWGEDFSPKEVVREALRSGSQSISYTYTEPTIFFEYAYQCARLAKEHGLYNNFVSNGYMSREALDMISPYLDACNVDLKSFSEKFYREICGARLQPVLESLKYIKKLGIWLEVTTLLIPELNDSQKELVEIAKFIHNELGAETPWHVSRFHPAYKLNYLPPESIKKILRAREIGIEQGLKYVYTGNLPGEAGESTYCPQCKEMIIERLGYRITNYHILQGKCKFCGQEIEGVGM